MQNCNLASIQFCRKQVNWGFLSIFKWKSAFWTDGSTSHSFKNPLCLRCIFGGRFISCWWVNRWTPHDIGTPMTSVKRCVFGMKITARALKQRWEFGQNPSQPVTRLEQAVAERTKVIFVWFQEDDSRFSLDPCFFNDSISLWNQT